MDAIMSINQVSEKSDPPPAKEMNPKTGKSWRRYCHTHGCCDHWGRTWADKATGRKDDATFWNHMGGSNKNCLPTN